MNNVINDLKGVTGINNEYFILVIISIIIILCLKVISKIICKMYALNRHTSRNIFKLM